ncbi:MAG: hypothetical protein AAFR13_08625 [Pseudomonadota bacterium]
MYDETRKPTWNVTFWALAAFALVAAAVYLAGAGNPEVAVAVTQPVG